MGFLIHYLSLVLLLSLYNVYGDEISMSFYQSVPHHKVASAPVHPPAVAPAPHHHKGGGHHHHHHHNHSKTPTKAPAYPPAVAPAPHHHNGGGHHHHAPAKAPVAPVPTPHSPSTHPLVRKLVAVQGVVYCKSCKYPGVNTLTGAYPIPGAIVKIACNNTKIPTVFNATTDKNGYFFILAPKTITTFGSHKCLASLVSSPLAKCNHPTGMHSGLKGAILMPPSMAHAPVADHLAHAPTAAAPVKPLPYVVFTVGPFAFEPSSNLPCT